MTKIEMTFLDTQRVVKPLSRTCTHMWRAQREKVRVCAYGEVLSVQCLQFVLNRMSSSPHHECLCDLLGFVFEMSVKRFSVDCFRQNVTDVVRCWYLNDHGTACCNHALDTQIASFNMALLAQASSTRKRFRA